MAAPKRARKLFVELRVAGIESALARREVTLEGEAVRLLSAGVRAEAAAALLENRLDDLIRLVSQDLAKEILAGINEVSAASYWDEVAAASEYLRWEMEPTAKHCDTCLARDGQVGTREEMEAAGLPGAGTTDCSVGCRCRIVPITKAEYDEGDKIV